MGQGTEEFREETPELRERLEHGRTRTPVDLCGRRVWRVEGGGEAVEACQPPVV